MKQFFKFMFASMLGILLSFFVAFVIFFFVIGGIISASQNESQPHVKNNTILRIKLDRKIEDQPSNNPLENIDLNTLEDKTPLSLSKIIANIKKAKDDDRIKGIYLDVKTLNANLASVEEIRNALIEFKSSGKFIISYAENFEQSKYYLSSVADQIYLHPGGNLEFKGLSTQLMFFKDALNRLDIEMQVIRHGKFKGAVEPFIRDNMSAENREQIHTLHSTIWNNISKNISNSRSIPQSKLDEFANNLSIRSPEDALDMGLVDALLYEDEVLTKFKELTNIDSEQELRFIALNRYRKVKYRKKGSQSEEPQERITSKNKIAVVFAEGEIRSGESTEDYMGSETIAKAIRSARNNKRIKAMVLRVNSPGGSALASEVIWREVVLAQKEKPVIVSMGNVAASGGYYISCAADKIFAESSTITGSIGVFGLIPNVEGMLKNKLGVSVDRATSHNYSDGLTLLRPMRETEREVIQEAVERIYDDFTRKVAEGRGMEQSEVDQIGQGRVWSGESALDIGLVDEIGGLNEAIKEAIKLAEVEDYKILELPEQEDPFEKLIQDLTTNTKLSLLGNQLGKVEKYYVQFKQVIDTEGIYTRLPIDIIIE